MAYATRQDIYNLGLPAQAFAPIPRVISAVDASAGVLSLPGHGFAVTDLLTFVLLGSTVQGATAPALPDGLSASVLYYALPLGSDLFKVALTSGGSAVTLLDVGSGTFGVRVDPGPRLDALLEGCAGDIDEKLTNYQVPIRLLPSGRYPQALINVNARMAARAAVAVLGTSNPQYADAAKQLLDGAAADAETLAGWKAGRPINAHPPDQGSSNRNAARASANAPSRNWESSPDGVLWGQ